MCFWVRGKPAAAPGRRLRPRPGEPSRSPGAASRRGPGSGSQVRPLRWPGSGPCPALPGRPPLLLLTGRPLTPRRAGLRLCSLVCGPGGPSCSAEGPRSGRHGVPTWVPSRRSSRGRHVQTVSSSFHSGRPRGPRPRPAHSTGLPPGAHTGVIHLSLASQSFSRTRADGLGRRRGQRTSRARRRGSTATLRGWSRCLRRRHPPSKPRAPQTMFKPFLFVSKFSAVVDVGRAASGSFPCSHDSTFRLAVLGGRRLLLAAPWRPRSSPRSGSGCFARLLAERAVV